MFALTPRELGCYLQGAARAEASEWRRTMWGAWHAAACARAKKLPDLKRLLRRLGGGEKPRRQSPEEMLAMVIELNAAFGGRDLRKKDLN